ncbi:hypothetical protein CK203_013877 [Vitis vinifera]|uniref:Uncharacterized protein n=1 Tax=Vitis vinifera TaxID=29760 RepID=A0A438JJQ1_VITVI|nr:hypothetical protein CK203_013877 [Vitis vinifera]
MSVFITGEEIQRIRDNFVTFPPHPNRIHGSHVSRRNQLLRCLLAFPPPPPTSGLSHPKAFKDSSSLKFHHSHQDLLHGQS